MPVREMFVPSGTQAIKISSLQEYHDLVVVPEWQRKQQERDGYYKLSWLELERKANVSGIEKLMKVAADSRFVAWHFLQNLADDFKLKNFPIPFSIFVLIDNRERWPIWFVGSSYDRDTGDYCEIPHCLTIDQYVLGCDTIEGLYFLFRKSLIAKLVHELDEAITVDGIRIFDPHKNDRQT